MTDIFKLYSSQGCHLCEHALAICSPLISHDALTVVDIVDDEAGENLVEQYGVHIPVLERMSDNQKLFWPFDEAQVAALI